MTNEEAVRFKNRKNLNGWGVKVLESNNIDILKKV